MIDCHMHMVLDGVDWRNAIGRHKDGPDMGFIRATLKKYQDLGFTYLRDGGDRWNVGKTARELAPEYGIRYRAPLAPLCKAGHYGSFIGRTFSDLKEFADLVKEQKMQGADFIKIMISGLMDFDRFGVLTEAPLDGEEIRQMVEISHDAGLSVMAHANGASAYFASRAGADSVEHGAYLSEDALYAMKEAGTVWVPTVSTIANLRGKGRFKEDAVVKILESAFGNIRKFASIGGHIAAGTDAGAWEVPHGSLGEADLLISAGATAENLEISGKVIQERF